MTQNAKLGSISFGSWWCGAGNDPRTTPHEGEEPTMRKGSYSQELVKIVDDTVNLVTPAASLVKIQGHTFEKSQ